MPTRATLLRRFACSPHIYPATSIPSAVRGLTRGMQSKQSQIPPSSTAVARVANSKMAESPGGHGDHFSYALNSNATWARYKAHQNLDFFPRMAAGQSPQILWLGCSDSRVPETTLLGLQPGDVFTHRNIANVITPTDLSVTAVLEFAINYLKVNHVVLGGHTCCGGAAAALGDDVLGGVLDTWIAPLRRIRDINRTYIEGEKGEVDSKERATRLAELNVREGVKVLLDNLTVKKAVEERGLKVHGVVYDVATGYLRDLGCGNGRKKQDDSSTSDSTTEGTDANIVRGQHGVLQFADGKASMVVR